MVKSIELLTFLEFLIANLKVENALKEDNLKAAFDFYDSVNIYD